MGTVTLEEIQITPLKRITVDGGDVLHARKATDPGFRGFGEAYFSMIRAGSVKAWKMHKRLTLNLVVPVGDVRFVLYAAGVTTPREEILGTSNYARMTVSPGLWFGFEGLSEPHSLILSLTDMPHDPDEVSRLPLHAFNYTWNNTR